MNAVFIVGIVFSGIILALAILAGTVLMIIRMRQTGISARAKNAHNEETIMIQEIYTGLSKMEQRVEALETILMEQKGKERQ